MEENGSPARVHTAAMWMVGAGCIAPALAFSKRNYLSEEAKTTPADTRAVTAAQSAVGVDKAPTAG
jgi:hypothetical protein